MQEPETRVVTVEYLNELYKEIETAKGEVEAYRAIFKVLALDPVQPFPITDRVFDLLAEDLSRMRDIDLTLEEIELLTERQRGVILLRLAGRSAKAIASDFGISANRVRELTLAAKRRIDRSRKVR